MGRRRYRQQDEDEGIFGLLLEASGRSAVVGLIVFLFLLVICGMFYSHPSALYGMAPMFGLLFLVMAGLVAFMTLIGVLTRSGASLANAARSIGSAAVRRTPKGRKFASGGLPKSRGAAAQPSLLSKGEMAFYGPLHEIVAGRFEIHIKPSLADVLQCRNHPQVRKIAAMHVDFLLCDRGTLVPRLAIELDDRSHRRPRRASADRWKAQLLAEKGIPLLRQRCEMAYDVQGLRHAIDHAIRR